MYTLSPRKGLSVMSSLDATVFDEWCKDICGQYSKFCGTWRNVTVRTWHHAWSGRPIRVWEWYMTSYSDLQGKKLILHTFWKDNKWNLRQKTQAKTIHLWTSQGPTRTRTWLQHSWENMDALEVFASILSTSLFYVKINSDGYHLKAYSLHHLCLNQTSNKSDCND